jgi:hypothetical protein
VIDVGSDIASHHLPHRTPEFQMANKTRKSANARAGNGGESHQNAGGPEQWLTTNQGTPISDNQNSLKSGERGPSLLEDFIPAREDHPFRP